MGLPPTEDISTLLWLKRVHYYKWSPFIHAPVPYLPALSSQSPSLVALGNQRTNEWGWKSPTWKETPYCRFCVRVFFASNLPYKYKKLCKSWNVPRTMYCNSDAFEGSISIDKWLQVCQFALNEPKRQRWVEVRRKGGSFHETWNIFSGSLRAHLRCLCLNREQNWNGAKIPFSNTSKCQDFTQNVHAQLSCSQGDLFH